VHFKEWFEKKVKKIQIPRGEKQEIVDNNNINSGSSNTVFKKKEANEEILSEDDDNNNTIASHHNNTIPEAITKFQSLSAKEETKEEVLGGGKLDMQLRQQQDHHQQQDYDSDHVLNILYDLPEHWIGKEMKLRIIANRRDATWITKRVLEDVERGLINAEFSVNGSDNHLCDVNFVLKISKGLSEFPAAVTAINPVLSFLLSDIKSEAILRRRRRKKLYHHVDH
jgi:hypothetical protein